MSKRVMIGLVVAMSLFVLLGTQAGAATCIQYRTIGGSSYCTAWSTKGVQLDLKFKGACLLPDTDIRNCTALVDVASSDNIAFCEDPSSPGGLRRVACTESLSFVTSSVSECVPKHEQDVDPTAKPGAGVGHEQHGCTQTFVLTAECNSCCAGIGTGQCRDATPVEMDTSVTVFAASGGGDLLVLSESSQSCSPEASSCTVQEHCSINPKKIVFNDPENPDPRLSQQYQCNAECVGSGCFSD
jgi:hypothetical protein